jgi:hypothetical protein
LLLFCGAANVIATAVAIIASDSVTTAVCTAIDFGGSRQPHVELGQPVLQGVDRHDTKNRSGVGVAQEHITERYHLQKQNILI